MNRSLGEWLIDPGLFVSSATLIALDILGMDAIQWDPTAVQTDLEEKTGIRFPKRVMDKIHSGMSLLGTDLYHTDLNAFSALTAAFNMESVSDTAVMANSLEDVMWGCTEARMLEGPETFDEGFNDEINAYVGVLLSAQGVSNPPSILKFAYYDPVQQEQETLALANDKMAAEAFWSREHETKRDLENDATEKMELLIRQLTHIPFVNGKPQLKKT